MLNSGTKLGSFEILSPLGAGGMGEVYRARDSKLGREVALKVLPEAFAADPQRMARFQREAQVLASLNHPNIASIYGLEESGSSRALVMELVEGQTLAERISVVAHGMRPPGETGAGERSSGSVGARLAPQQLDETLHIAKQIAEALEYAHERGIIHRDLKPANIKLTPEGSVKVLDFGLAKALDVDPTGSNLANSPTLSPTLSIAATQAGMILGTAAYMSPEQAKGKTVDRRADIWAFGAVLYEMLGGKQPFNGETVSDTLAEVLKFEPDWSALPPDTPLVIQKLLRRCLIKDPKQRLRDIGEARIAIEEVLSGDVGPGLAPALPEGAAKPPQGAALQRALPWALACFATVGLLIAIYVAMRATRSSPPVPMELSLGIPSTVQLATGSGPAIVLSSDGLRVAYSAQNSQGRNQIYVRELDQAVSTPLEGAVGTSLFFSPDGQWIGFQGSSQLEKVSVFGGSPMVICKSNASRGASWSEGGAIVFPVTLTSPLYRVSAAGGEPVALTHLDQARKEVTHRWPQFLPGGKTVLFTASADNNNFEHSSVQAVSLSTGEAKVLVENAYFGRYLPSGYLVYVSGSTLFAVPFDAEGLKVTGTAMPVVQDIQADPTNGSAQFSASSHGTAVYLTGQLNGSQVTVALVDRKGVASPLVKQPGDYYSPRFSPDGKQLALQVGFGNVWVSDLARGTMTPLTLSPADCLAPVWSPDGKNIACEEANPAAGGINISWIPSDGTGSLKPLTKGSSQVQMPSSWSPDGKNLFFYGLRPNIGGCCEIWNLPINPNGQPGEPEPLIGQNSPHIFVNPALSPDGHWLAYQSNESGSRQIYVVPFPGPGGKRQISNTDGGYRGYPRWSKAAHELFFVEQVEKEMAVVSVPYTIQGNAFQPGKPSTLFQGRFELRLPYSSFDVAPDGRHFALLQPPEGVATVQSAPTLVVNWFARVQKLVTAGQK